MTYVSEKELQDHIRIELSKKGFCVFRTNVGRFKTGNRWIDIGLPKGFSDLFAIKDGKVYFIEVKNIKGRVSEHQKHFIETMKNRYGCIAGVCRSVEDALKLVGEKTY